LRPRWNTLYAARKRQKDEAARLPELPDTFFGWIVPLWKITDQQILASAGLDAYAFLYFFKFATRWLLLVLFFSLTVIKPVHDAFPDVDPKQNKHGNKTEDGNSTSSMYLLGQHSDRLSIDLTSLHALTSMVPAQMETDYLWMYLVFAYFFTGVAMYMIITSTKRMIQVRQEYLGSKTTITDRTIRLSGIPKDLQSEEKIKDFMESLEIGKVESVTLCKQWKELDDMMVKRNAILRKLEEALTVYMGYRSVERNLETLPIAQPSPPGPSVDEPAENEEDNGPLLPSNGQNNSVPYARQRPKAKLRYGHLMLQSKEVDAINHYQEELRQTDEKIMELRKKDFETTPLAFVTMDSVAACQMAVQAVLDPGPGQLLANLSPAPTDVVWPNTYLSRRSRMIRAWSITALIIPLTIFWGLLFAPIAGALSTNAIREVLPRLADWLDEHPTAESIVNTQLPTLITALLNVAAPYLYDCKPFSHSMF